MNLIDVTLRDGGHQTDFNWSDDFLGKYLPVVSKIEEVDYVELGYWSQTAKSRNRFYNMGPSDLEKFVSMGLTKPASIMLDYHYCSHDFADYISDAFISHVALVRLCSRREDIKEAVRFCRNLIDKVNVKLSLNFFNITNYSKEEIEYCIENGKDAGATFLYFADTHGALDLHRDGNIFSDYADMIKDNEMIPGLHLHDHSGKAYMNYRLGIDLGFQSFDCSVGGMGKGVGNLKMEHVINPLANLDLLDFLEEERLLRMPALIPGLVTSALSATDYYAVRAKNLGIKSSVLCNLLKAKSSSERDIFNESILAESQK